MKGGQGAKAEEAKDSRALVDPISQNLNVKSREIWQRWLKVHVVLAAVRSIRYP